MSQLQRDQFNKIYQGTNELIKDLCREGDYQDEFLKHSNCLQTVKPLHVKCNSRYQLTMASIFKASENRTTQNQQQQQVSGESDAENVKIVCWWVVHTVYRASEVLKYCLASWKLHDPETPFSNQFLFFYSCSICSSFKEYLDCSEHVTRRTCGTETGLFIRDFLRRMSESLMQNFCEESQQESNQCPNKFSTATKCPPSAFPLILLVTLVIRRISWKLMGNVQRVRKISSAICICCRKQKR